MEIYAITGKYFHIAKEYSYKDLSSFANFLKNSSQPKIKPRISVVDTIARQNGPKEVVIKVMNEKDVCSEKEILSNETFSKKSSNQETFSMPLYEN